MTQLTTLLQQSGSSAGGYMNIIMIVLMIAIFYFFMIRPQQRRQKELQKAREAMKPGDKIVTSGGIFGTIREINSATNSATIEVWEGVKFRINLNDVFALPEERDPKRS